MKYLPLAEFDTVTNALNFSTPDLHVIGGCDVYTTKAAGGDKKLYKNIDNSLEAQYQSLVRLSASLSPPARSGLPDHGKDGREKRSGTAEPPEINLSRDSPFGPLSKISARRTFAYLIATLNASHPDYDFSNQLRPRDFKHERSLRGVMHNIDSTLHNLRPRFATPYLSPPLLSSSTSITNSLGNEIWSPRMWSLIDKEMGLRQCEKYSYVPDDDPFDGEDGSIWSMHYFFFNKERKRVCYLYLRGLSVISHSPVTVPALLKPKAIRKKNSSVSVGEGAGKRASYWFSDSAAEPYGYEDDDDEMVVAEPNDDEVEVPYMDLDEIRADLQQGVYRYDYAAQEEEEDDDEGYWPVPEAEMQRVRGVSEEIGDAMEM